MENAPVFRLVAGLGNPGRKYAGTRHNVGFLVLDELARRSAAKFQFEAKWDAEVVSCGGRMLMKPQTFMNLSGESVGNYTRFYRFETTEVLVVIDDAAIPLGEIRLRASGSDGGHHGLGSVLMHQGSEVVPRLRVGIGGTAGPLENHVLGMFAPEEIPAVEAAVARAADAVEYANAHGIEAAMNLYNQKTTV